MNIKNKLKFVSILVFFLMSLVGAYFATYDKSYADHCSGDPSDESCHVCFNNGIYPTCICAESDEDWGGFCVARCGSGQIRNQGGECVSYCNDFNACNPGAYEACDYDSCQTCPEGQSGTYPDCGTCDAPTAGTYPDCTCENGAGNPPMCNDYCSDHTAINYGEALPCEYDGPACCSNSDALDFDSSCPDTAANPPSHSDESSCTFCTPDNNLPECTIYYCGDAQAQNKDPGGANCQANNPTKNCAQSDFTCTYPDLYYCDDDTATNSDPGGATCVSQKVSSRQQCIQDNTYCTYPDESYCDDDRAMNYDAGGANCQANNPNATCVADNGVCSYSYCTVLFSLDVECPSGFTYSTPTGQYFSYSYQYSPNSPYFESCPPSLTPEVSGYLGSYFEQRYCGAGQNVACEGGFCGQIDWCSDMPDVQTDPEMCIDVCPDDAGTQTSESQCTCLNGSCDVIDAVCGSLNGGAVASESEILGTGACLTGDLGTVSYANGQYTWGCTGVNGGVNSSCAADIDCGNKYYCNYRDQCLPYSSACEPPNDCVNPSYLCVPKSAVTLDSNLNVNAIINNDNSCIIDIGPGENGDYGVFESFKSNTHCILSSQNGVISTFDPKDIGNTNPDLGPVVPLVFQQDNIQRDMIYTLKCYEGNVPSSEVGYEKSVGACRLNIKTKESN